MKKAILFLFAAFTILTAKAQYFQHVYGTQKQDILLGREYHDTRYSTRPYYGGVYGHYSPL